MIPVANLETERDFNFPFTPWSIQKDFMNHLYDGLQNGKVLVMESPTGTGKSLSLICGSLKWLKDHEERTEKERMQEIEDERAALGAPLADEPSWVLDFAKEEVAKDVQDIIAKKRKREERLAEIRRRALSGEEDDKAKHRFKRPKTAGAQKDSQDDEDRLIVDYDSETEISKPKASFLDGPEDPTEDDLDLPDETKIIYCSRTHSQISQFVKELRRSAYSSTTKSVSLGSRQGMCINESVRKLGSLPKMNDRCLDLMKASTKEEGGCEYLAKDPATRVQFTDQLHAAIRDIEDMVDLGKRLHTCPYYAARDAVRPSQVLTLPYNLLLQASARESLGIDVKGKVVIIDEAHNLIDTITSIYSVSLTLQDLERAARQLQGYLQRYKKRLKGCNLAYIRQLNVIIGALKKPLTKPVAKAKDDRSVVMVNDFVHMLSIDHINLFKIGHYLAESRLGQKLQGFAEKFDMKGMDEGESEVYVPKHMSTIQNVSTFLMSLTNADLEGRIMLSVTDDPATSMMKYLLLNPANAFRRIVEEARAVVLAGGTMAPIPQLVDELFLYVPKDRLSPFSCGHIIPATSILSIAAATGPTGRPFDVTFEHRSEPSLMNELGAAIANLCNVVPGGVVCFFGSYDYMDKVNGHWEKEGLLKRICAKKQVFKEPKQSSMVEPTLREYATCIEGGRKPGAKQTGGILFAVVGGKMSEGIKLVIVVGLPFPNPNSLELQEKLKYMKSRASTAASSKEDVVSDYYENICMKAVNQSIGRAIRHKDDYAAIVLLDRRYQQRRIKSKLPAWIRDAGVMEHNGFGMVVGAVANFFRNKRTPPNPH
ncbi:putative ATP-dependent RNA helicase DDX11-like protein 8-like protein [Fimicolochytrium jonesii]|uniref:putative ATP-dependent RNA helicase DDX11-like protein 8-like protein n=1 Tax=Fimicolochytrium jonesii TaxID=1396493 RepID=UPI0022FE2318|nr:putative ATP-dependent RNA helicase DDX11-like protein 8-like protein [Fimicolochytrium jonesii]KAI8820477.1 putative ATP-dependent RNA helicase DDX11-like protein 8-like protein [Fimicolochytrium jonesii]